MFGADAWWGKWAAVAVAGAPAARLLRPSARMVFAVLYGRLPGEAVRWN